jgi:hypothetical protein
MRIRGVDKLTMEMIESELALGGRFVFYEYCISILFATLRRPSDIVFLKANDQGIVRGLPYVLISLLFGWWGIPFGLIYTPMTIFTNLSGGRELSDQATFEVLNWLQTSNVPRMVPCDES